MNEDTAFLRSVIAFPEDATARLVYADWLDDRNDPRAELLRTGWDASRLSFVDWIAQQGHLDYYLGAHPDLRPRAAEREANARWRAKLEHLGETVDPRWVTLVDAFGRPFRPFFFWNNTGPRAFADGELPFTEPIGTRGTVVTFESAFRGPGAWQPGLDEDLCFLHGLALDECAYGSTSCPIHPFVCELEGHERPLTGAAVLRALKARDFRSIHIPDLDARTIAFPGYQPCTANDEVHNDRDPAGQGIFSRPEDVPVDASAESAGAHAALRAGVANGDLWYVLLHSRGAPEGRAPEDDDDKGTWVVLFAVGRSPRGNRLIGVVTHQACHNFCD